MPTGVRRPILALVSYFEQFYRLSSGLEHIILSHMAKHLFLNNILIDQQHGFREKFSCEIQLISAIHDWAKGINFRSQTDVILLDFSKAFDSVPHKRLLVKLDFDGIRGKMQTKGFSQWSSFIVKTCRIWSYSGLCLGSGAIFIIHK